jgi:hypothetical protein
MSFQHKRYNSRRSFLLLYTLPCLKFITVSSFFLILFDCGARTSPLTPLKIQLVAFGAFSPIFQTREENVFVQNAILGLCSAEFLQIIGARKI